MNYQQPTSQYTAQVGNTVVAKAKIDSPYAQIESEKTITPLNDSIIKTATTSGVTTKFNDAAQRDSKTYGADISFRRSAAKEGSDAIKHKREEAVYDDFALSTVNGEATQAQSTNGGWDSTYDDDGKRDDVIGNLGGSFGGAGGSFGGFGGGSSFSGAYW